MPGVSGYEIMWGRCPESLQNGVLRSGMHRKIKGRAGIRWTARQGETTRAEK